MTIVLRRAQSKHTFHQETLRQSAFDELVKIEGFVERRSQRSPTCMSTSQFAAVHVEATRIQQCSFCGTKFQWNRTVNCHMKRFH